MSTSYGGDHVHISGGEFRGQVVGKQVNHYYGSLAQDGPPVTTAAPVPLHDALREPRSLLAEVDRRFTGRAWAVGEFRDFT